MHHERKRYWDLDALLRLRAFNKVRERVKWLENVQKMSRKSKVNLLLSLQGCDWCDIGPFNFISLDLKTWGVAIQMKLILQNICIVLFISQGFIKMIIMNSAGNFFFDFCYEAKENVKFNFFFRLLSLTTMWEDISWKMVSTSALNNCILRLFALEFTLCVVRGSPHSLFLDPIWTKRCNLLGKKDCTHRAWSCRL